MRKRTPMTWEQLFFSVICIEALSDELNTTGDEIYKMLAEKSDILDAYIVPFHDVLHTQGLKYIVSELIDLMKERGVEQ
ncbi:MAG: DUF3791 domain-containing protein [Oscillospiraceae bacterium]|nr:DUF3791 domain-containing protein [Oscillospiraceae bacterium]